MDGMILLNVYSTAIKNDILSLLVTFKLGFMEAFSNNEVMFKYNLVKDQVALYVHEIDDKAYQEACEIIEKVRAHKVKTIVLIHKYDIGVIDDMTRLGVMDIIVMPMTREKLKSKLLANYRMPEDLNRIQAKDKDDKEDKENETLVDEARVNNEINRAMRGQYPLSIILLHYAHIDYETYLDLKKRLQTILRTTDVLFRYNPQQLIILCPFTPKNYLVEVENKIRETFKVFNTTIANKGALYIHGVTYPEDGATMKHLFKLLEAGIHDSMLLQSINGTFKDLDSNKIEAYRKRFKRYYQ